jgi:thiosulfate/3-mercaptopyruvate sulfurtransferase
MSHLRLLLALLLAAPAAAAPLLITPKELHKKQKGAVVLDARDDAKYEEGHIPGAISLPWVDLAHMPKSPKVRDPQALSDLLTSKGVSSERWLVVYGDGADGWGEEGRLWWTLAYLGHKNVTVLDGGLPAWKKAELELTTEGPDLPRGKFKARPTAAYRVELAALKESLAQKKVQLLDVREADEFRGARKFNEPRGGRIPGAINLPWKKLLSAEGTLLPKAELRKLLEAQGLRLDLPVAVYCTGGIRSGYAFFALKAAGVAVSNYDGSFWEWAQDPSLPIESG